MNDGINADFERPCSIPDADTVEYHLGNLSYDAELAGFISIDEQKHTGHSRQRNRSRPLVGFYP